MAPFHAQWRYYLYTLELGICVNSVDTEAREITGTIPGIKSWLVVMERRVLLYGKNGNGMLCPFRFLSSFSNLYYEKSVWCGIVERSGNVLHIKTLCTQRPLHLRVDVNRIFSLKLTFTKPYLCSDKKLIFYLWTIWTLESLINRNDIQRIVYSGSS